MPRDKRNLDRFLVEVSQHYKKRGFNERAVSVLRQTIITNTKAGQFAVANTTHNFQCLISDLLDCFKIPAAKPTDAELRTAKAIFAFSFGYRLDDPADSTPANRRPGKNNERLAKIANALRKKYKCPLYVQFEIARATALSDVKKFKSTVEDLSTKEVVSQFLAIAESHDISKPSKVIVVAHGHHMERCVQLLVQYFDIRGLPSPKDYCRYDPKESQPRTMSADDNIVNDFISMASMQKDKIFRVKKNGC